MTVTMTEIRTSGTEWQFANGKKIDRDTGDETSPIKIKTPLSSNNMTRYTTLLWGDGVVTCDCPGWTMKKKGPKNPDGHRTCRHCKEAIACDGSDMSQTENFVMPTQGPQVSGRQFVPRARQFRKIVMKKQPDVSDGS